MHVIGPRMEVEVKEADVGPDHEDEEEGSIGGVDFVWHERPLSWQRQDQRQADGRYALGSRAYSSPLHCIPPTLSWSPTFCPAPER